MKLLIFFSFILVINTACGQKITSTSYWKKGEDFPKKESGIHQKSGIKWWLMNDSKNLYIKFITTDRNIQMVLMKEGFRFYFDTVKQKNKKNCLVYTNDSKKPGQTGNKPSPEKGPQDKPMFHPARNDNIIKDYTQAIWQDISYNLELEITDFSASFILDTNDVLTCYAVIPFKVISNKGLNDIHKLSVCLEIQSKGQPMNAPSHHQGGPGSFHSGPPQGGPPQGNPKQGGRPERMGGPPAMVGTGTPPNSTTPKKLVKFWFLTNLAYSPD